MKLFINDKYVHVLSAGDFASHHRSFDLEISPDIPLSAVKLQGQVLVWQGTPAYMDALITLMEVKKLKRLEHILFVTEQYEEVKEFVKSQFKIIKAAGGLVLKGDRILLMHRLGVWDLPKGKLERGERTLEGALREVAEECSIVVSAEAKITSTWHTYVSDGRRILKKTTWYLMHCIDDRAMTPQLEENIDELRWMTRSEAELAVSGSYASIQEVFVTFFKERALEERS